MASAPKLTTEIPGVFQESWSLFYYVISDGCVQTASCLNMIILEIGDVQNLPIFTSCTCHQLSVLTHQVVEWKRGYIYRKNRRNLINYYIGNLHILFMTCQIYDFS